MAIATTNEQTKGGQHKGNGKAPLSANLDRDTAMEISGQEEILRGTTYKMGTA